MISRTDDRPDLSTLLARGSHNAALQAIRRIESRRALSIHEQVLFAELSSLTGATESAFTAGRRLIKQRGLSIAQRCRVRGVLGKSLFRKGETERGVDQFLAGIELADQHNELFEECRLRVELFRSQIHWVGPHQAAANLTTLQRKTYHLAEPSVTIGFQLGLTELAAKLALLPRAQEHLDTAKALLPTVQDQAIEADLKFVEFVLTGYQSNYADALKYGIELASLDEKTATSVALHGNLGHFFMMQCRFDEALEWLNRALTEHAHDGPAQVGLSNTLMQVRLGQGSLDDAALLAESIQQLLDRTEAADSYYGLDHLLTRVKWLYRIGDAEAGLATAVDAIPRMERMADRNFLYLMKLLAAEGLGRTGRSVEGAKLMAETVNSNVDPSPEAVAEALRVSGRLTADRDPTVALSCFQRAVRILDVLGNLLAVAEIRRDAEGTLGPNALPSSSTDSGRVVESSQFVPATSGRVATGALADHISTLVALGSHPRLLATEALAVIADTCEVFEATVIETDSDGQSKAMASVSAEASPTLAGHPEMVRIECGEHQKRQYEIHALPRPTAAARAALLAIERLVETARSIARARQMAREQAALWPDQTPEQQLGLICTSERMTDLIKTIRRVAPSNVPVLITGETGVGKELFARALHQASLRNQQVFLPFNCTTVPREMIDSQLFGYRRGAFTGAQEDSPGLIRSAAGGTLFLDEIGEMSAESQPKLLRFLESGEILPLGTSKPHIVDVRVVAATNADIDELVRQGRFREDLFYRLNVIRIHVPPLRERREEIPLLVDHFLEIYGRELTRPAMRFADETLEYLVLYPWPGNVRQLANEVRRMVALAEPGAVLMPEHLSAEIFASRRTIPATRQPFDQTEVVTRTDQPLAAALEHVERAVIQRAIAACDGRVDEAAKMLGLSRKGLYLKRQRLGLE